MTEHGEGLRPGTRIGEFEIVRELGAGGFGITYLAEDRSLGRRVAVKEYFLGDWGSRRPDGTVGPRLSGSASDYAWGLERFVEEARVLARLEHPNIVRFAMPVVLSEEDEVTSSFAYALPVQSEWASALSSITLSGPGGSVTLDGDADRPMAILRNPLTGQVRGFLDDQPQAAEAAMDVAWRATEPGLDVLFSRGIPDTMAWQR